MAPTGGKGEIARGANMINVTPLRNVGGPRTNPRIRCLFVSEGPLKTQIGAL